MSNNDLVGKIMQYEQGDMTDHDDVINFFQELIDTGMINQLQGHYGRTAKHLINRGYCSVAVRGIAGGKGENTVTILEKNGEALFTIVRAQELMINWDKVKQLNLCVSVK